MFTESEEISGCGAALSGWVDAESILGSGSCFTVGMPCEPKPEPEAEEVTEEEKTVDALLEGIAGTDITEEETDADLTTEAEGAVETDATTEEAETDVTSEINETAGMIFRLESVIFLR